MRSSRFQHYGSYKFDRWIFQVGMVLIFGFLFLVAQHYDFKMNYFKCERPLNYQLDQSDLPISQQCENPFYKPVTWENQQYLPPGEYGVKLDGWYYSAWPVTIGIIVFGLVLNHFWHNRKYKFDFKEVDMDEDDKDSTIELGR